MKTSIWAVVLLFGVSLSVTPLQAQEHGLFKDWAVGLEFGLGGVGVTATTSLSPHWKLRSGIDLFPYSYNDKIDWDMDGYVINNPSQVAHDANTQIDKLKLSMINFKALVDWYPMQNGIFSLTAGFYLGRDRIDASASVANYAALCSQYGGDLVFDVTDDITIKPAPDGHFDATINMGGIIKPYFGLGLGRTIANKRLGFKFDLGLVYRGALTVDSDYATHVDKSTAAAADKVDFPLWVTKFWPILNFSFTWRL